MQSSWRSAPRRAAIAWLLTDPQFAQRRLSQLAPSARARREAGLRGRRRSQRVRQARSAIRPEVSQGDGTDRAHARGRGILRRLAGDAVCDRSSCSRRSCSAAPSSTSSVGRRATLVFAGLAAALGYYLPDVWLGRAIERATQADQRRPSGRHRPADCLHRVGVGHRSGAQPRRRRAGHRLPGAVEPSSS